MGMLKKFRPTKGTEPTRKQRAKLYMRAAEILLEDGLCTYCLHDGDFPPETYEESRTRSHCAVGAINVAAAEAGLLTGLQLASYHDELRDVILEEYLCTPRGEYLAPKEKNYWLSDNHHIIDYNDSNKNAKKVRAKLRQIARKLDPNVTI